MPKIARRDVASPAIVAETNIEESDLLMVAGKNQKLANVAKKRPMFAMFSWVSFMMFLSKSWQKSTALKLECQG
ncbi:MAG: hypothetical protein KGZ45_00860 [Clostridium sp.]|nr:hypothetical protein [Clostridium sp.]